MLQHEETKAIKKIQEKQEKRRKILNSVYNSDTKIIEKHIKLRQHDHSLEKIKEEIDIRKKKRDKCKSPSKDDSK